MLLPAVQKVAHSGRDPLCPSWEKGGGVRVPSKQKKKQNKKNHPPKCHSQRDAGPAKQKGNGKTQEVFTCLTGETITVDGQPLSIVEDGVFRWLLHYVAPWYHSLVENHEPVSLALHALLCGRDGHGQALQSELYTSQQTYGTASSIATSPSPSTD